MTWICHWIVDHLINHNLKRSPLCSQSSWQTTLSKLNWINHIFKTKNFHPLKPPLYCPLKTHINAYVLTGFPLPPPWEPPNHRPSDTSQIMKSGEPCWGTKDNPQGERRSNKNAQMVRMPGCWLVSWWMDWLMMDWLMIAVWCKWWWWWWRRTSLAIVIILVAAVVAFILRRWSCCCCCCCCRRHCQHKYLMMLVSVIVDLSATVMLKLMWLWQS